MYNIAVLGIYLAKQMNLVNFIVCKSSVSVHLNDLKAVGVVGVVVIGVVVVYHEYSRID
jgi:hypothetical protein